MPSSFGLTTQIYNNHIKSGILLAGFPLLLLAMMGGFFIIMNALMQSSVPGAAVNWAAAFNAGWAGVLQYGGWAFAAAGIWFVIAYFFHDSIMRMATGAQPVTRQQYPKIYNMLENLCISRGLAMPAFEIIDSPALNAFATGIDQKSFKIVLTRGLVEHLPDDELESVIGHELTHIMNRDVRLLVISIIFVGIISFLAQMAYQSLIFGNTPNFYARRDDREGGGAAALAALGVLAVGYALAILIRFALSRKREYLADAGSVELTKNPEAMMKALIRIAGHDELPHFPHEMQQMCIENSQGSIIGMFATHPPIEARIKMISEMTNTPVPTLPPPAAPVPTGPWS
ncbi:MAG: M48 family metallopeptidase [Alphaproteobacteria bacterium]|nr:M48 family metallopeptidase [Alphaproteobacteria bacterium]MDE2337554.1 M48 family metallopeptidase [Alphaproteobacteria bacterium]